MQGANNTANAAATVVTPSNSWNVGQGPTDEEVYDQLATEAQPARVSSRHRRYPLPSLTPHEAAAIERACGNDPAMFGLPTEPPPTRQLTLDELDRLTEELATNPTSPSKPSPEARQPEPPQARPRRVTAKQRRTGYALGTGIVTGAVAITLIAGLLLAAGAINSFSLDHSRLVKTVNATAYVNTLPGLTLSSPAKINLQLKIRFLPDGTLHIVSCQQAPQPTTSAAKQPLTSPAPSRTININGR